MDDPACSAPTVAEGRRRGAVAIIFAGAGLSTTGYLMSYTVNALIAEALHVDAALVGVPSAVTVLGTAIGSSLLTRGRGPGASRRAMLGGYLLATVAGIAAAVAIGAHRFWLFVATTLLFGVGYGANRIARYSAAALYPAARRGAVIGWVVWAATIGAVVGPSLIEFASQGAERAGFDRMIGPYVAAAAMMLLSAAVTWGMPVVANHEAPPPPAGTAASPASVRALLAGGDAWLGLTAMLCGQVAMVLVMTMTPLHMHHHGATLPAIGLVISTHTLGMYGAAPLTGRLADRIGPRTVIAIGTVLLVIACVIAATLQAHPTAVLVALGLLGLGWNFDFVAGSASLTRGVHSAAQTRLQGFADGLVWTTSALAGLLAGVLLDKVGFVGLSTAGAIIATAPWWIPTPRRLLASRVGDSPHDSRAGHPA
ncbi:MAG: MFS transporter [Vicinamibacteraceae bacterium]